LKQMNYGKRNEKIEYRFRDEIGELVEQYNKTIDALEESATKLAQTERETAWKTMARQIAHEINNPLTPMKLTIQQLQRTKQLNDERFDDYFEKSTKTLIEQINNLSRIAGTFSNFARMPEAQFSKFDIAEKLSLTVALFASNNEKTSINYHGAQSNVFVVADAEQMIQVFNNLLKNALQSIPENKKGRIDVKLDVFENTDKKQVLISISDNGIGMSSDVQEKLFSPNFSTKSTGMGLGLSISKNIVETSGGKISYSTELGIGTTFNIEL
jgi:two-component system nitrogen regulation sensor histidine kinase NtrY